MHRTPIAIAAFVAAVLLSVGACGDGGDAGGGDESGTGACGPDRQERVDPASANHVLAGGEEPEYQSDPPTSGAHAPGPARSGVLDEPLSRPEQVGHLEAGGVLVQFRDLGPAPLAALEPLADDGVVLAPNPDLPAPIVATAWTRKMVCESEDLAALTAFAEAHLGNGPGTDG